MITVIVYIYNTPTLTGPCLQMSLNVYVHTAYICVGVCADIQAWGPGGYEGLLHCASYSARALLRGCWCVLHVHVYTCTHVSALSRE